MFFFLGGGGNPENRICDARSYEFLTTNKQTNKQTNIQANKESNKREDGTQVWQIVNDFFLQWPEYA